MPINPNNKMPIRTHRIMLCLKLDLWSNQARLCASSQALETTLLCICAAQTAAIYVAGPRKRLRLRKTQNRQKVGQSRRESESYLTIKTYLLIQASALFSFGFIRRAGLDGRGSAGPYSTSNRQNPRGSQTLIDCFLFEG
jgi:hypothetical protein